MSDLDLAAIRARADAATPGRWFVGHDYEEPAFWIETDHDGGSPVCGLDDSRPNDAEFIAAAREDVPKLVERIAELEGQVKTLQRLAHGLIQDDDAVRGDGIEGWIDDLRAALEAVKPDGEYRAARGVVKRVPGDELPEDTIRRLRDSE